MSILPCRKTPPNAIVPYLHRWQSNNSPTNLGIKNFVFDLFEMNRQMGYPPLLRDFKPEYGIAPWAAKSLSEYFLWEEGMSKEDRCFVILTYREGSKTTWYSYMLPIYEMLIGQYGIYYQDMVFPEVDYQILRAKNNRESKKRILFISNFLNKPIIRHLFGNLKPTFKEVREKEGKDEGTLMILNNGYIFECSGIDQPSRGMNILGVRPKKITFDDIQNRDNVKTPERRKSIDEEVMQESFPAIADEGSLVYVCNRVHPADTAGRLIDHRNHTWKKSVYTLTMIKKPDGELLPGVGNFDQEIPEWGRRYTIERCKKRIEWFSSQPDLGGISGALKNYYNLIRSDADYQIKYYDALYVREHNINWVVFRDEKGQKIYKNVYIVVALDPAISESKKACDAAVVVLAIDSDKHRYILELKYGKWDIRDRFIDEDTKPARGFAITIDELANVKRIGSSHEVARMAIKYHADAINIEARVGQQLTFYNEADVALKAVGWSGILKPESAPPEGKIEKLRQTPLIYFEAGLYYLPGIKKEEQMQPRGDVLELRNDVIAFPDCAKDRLDSLYLAEQLVQYPTPIQYNPLGIYIKAVEPYETEEQQIHRSGSYLNENESWITL